MKIMPVSKPKRAVAVPPLTAAVMALAMLTASVNASVTVPIPLSVMLQEVAMGAKLMHGTLTVDSTNRDGSVNVVLKVSLHEANPTLPKEPQGILIWKMKLVGSGNKTSIQTVDGQAYTSDGRSACLNKQQLAFVEKMYAQELTRTLREQNTEAKQNE
jgi:hypothetical protein